MSFSVREADKGRVEALKKHVSESKSYTIERLLKKYNLWVNPQDKAGQKVLNCPFHTELDPSFYVNDNMRVCNCLSCGKGGNYIRYSFLINKYLLKNGMGYFALLQNILAEDKQMQIALGFTSIYTSSSIRKTLPTVERRRFKKPTQDFVKDFSDLSAWMKKVGKDTPEFIILASLFMQQGMKPEHIYQELNTEGQVAASYDLMDSLNWDTVG